MSQDLEGALFDMAALARGTNCERPLYHASISPALAYTLTDEQKLESVNAFEEKLGLTDHVRAIILHEKEGRERMHIVWARVDAHTNTVSRDSFNYRKHEEVARDLGDYMSPIDVETLPSIANARELQTNILTHEDLKEHYSMTDRQIELLSMVADKEQARTAEFYKQHNFSERKIDLLEAKYARGDDHVNQT